MNNRILKKLYLAATVFIIAVKPIRAQHLPVNSGPFKPTDESFRQYRYPSWFRDAKFGIWAHWGPQAVPRQGEYARSLYIQGSRQNKYHVTHYGPPSKFGYKDIIPLWKAEKWNPEQLMSLFKRAGAKYFVSMAVHHDNFFLWNSKIHRWNSVMMGPHKDVVGLWQQAAQKEGLKFGVSEHLARSYTWLQVAHGSDTTGQYKGIPYDGVDPQYADLYHTKGGPDDKEGLTKNTDWMKEWYRDIKELVDTYHPDLLYSDSKLPFDTIGKDMLANYYNGNILFNKGKLTAVYNCKESSGGRWVQDVERGVIDSISPYPWQTDTSIGDWYYRTGQQYKTSTQIIQMLLDIVSKNGNLLINVVQTPEGDLEPDVVKIVNELAEWMPANSEGIFGTRPWKVYGEGPSTDKANQPKGKYGGISDTRTYQASDIRFTSKGKTLFAFCMDATAGDIRIVSLGKNSKFADRGISSVKMLGSNSNLKWRQENGALVVTKPDDNKNWRVRGLKIEFKD